MNKECKKRDPVSHNVNFLCYNAAVTLFKAVHLSRVQNPNTKQRDTIWNQLKPNPLITQKD